MEKVISRRDFLAKSATVGAGVYPAMLALNLLPAAPAHAFDLRPGSGQGKHVIILGGGLAGLTSAYELRKLGYRCTILEARQRSGGRCWSVRGGATTAESTNPQQTANFDKGLYFNAGPSRIPHHHQLVMHYCKELGVPLEVYNNVNEGSYYFAEGKGPLSNKKVRAREIHNDVRGYMHELLAKTVSQHQADTGLTAEDGAKVLEYLRAEGGLDIDKLYKASARRGYVEAPGAGNQAGKLTNPHRLADIVSSGLLDPDFYNVAEYTYELQMTMFQAVGGMDRIAQALERKVADCLKLGAAVTAIHNQPDGVRVVYQDQQGPHELAGDLCICTLPLPVLSNLTHNFSAEVSRAIDYVPYIQVGKIGLQFKRRFWEEDEQIYGGITHTNNELTQIFYPSYDYLSQKGILIGYYNFNEKAQRVGELTYAQREQLALQKGQLIHPQYAKEFEQSFSVSWHKQPYSLGGWALYSPEERQGIYQALLKPDHNVHFAGEHTTYLTAWMAGAFESARSAVAAVHNRLSAQRVAYPTVKS